MMSAMRLRVTLTLAALLCAAAAIPLRADNKAFLGRWNLTGTGDDSAAIFWLEVKEESGQLAGMFLNRGGSPVKLASIAVKGDELVWFYLPVFGVPALVLLAGFWIARRTGALSWRGGHA